jgi:hypothetical protein
MRAIKDRLVSMLLRLLSYQPGSVIDSDDRKYVIDINGSRRRLRRGE